MAAEYSRTMRFEGVNDNNLLITCERAVCQLGFRVKSTDGSSKLIAKTPLNFFSWGEVITVELSKSNSTTEVVIRSRRPLITRLVDWGKNRKNVTAIVDRIQTNQKAV